MSTLGLLFIVIGLLAALSGGIWTIVLAFQKSLGWGLGCLLFPILSIAFIVLHFKKAVWPTVLQLAGLLIAIGGGILMSLGGSPNLNSMARENPSAHQPSYETQNSAANPDNSARSGELVPAGDVHLANGIALFNERKFDAAANAFSEQIAQSPKDFRAYNWRGLTRQDLRDFQGADRDFAEALALIPPEDRDNRAYSLIGRASALNELKSYDEAIRLSGEAISLNSQKSRALAVRGFAFKGKGEFGKAIADCNESIQLDPATPWTFVTRGIAHFFEKDHLDDAKKDLTEAIRLDPGIAIAFQFRARSLHKQDKDDEAFQDYTEAIRLNPNDAVSYFNRALIWEQRGDWAAAIQDATEAIRINPQMPDAYATRGRVRHDQELLDDALIDLNEAIRLNPKDANSHSNRGMIWETKGDLEAAIKDCSEAIRLRPQDPDAYHTRARVRQLQNRLDDAIQDYAEAIRFAPTSPSIIANRGLVLQSKGDVDAAIRDFSEAIRLDPTDSQIYFFRGVACIAKRHYDASATDAAEAIRLDDENADAFNCLARLRAICSDGKIRNGKQAVELAMKACELSEWKNGSYLETLAAAYAESKDWENAILRQNQAIEIAVTDDVLNQAKKRHALYKQHKANREVDWMPKLPATVFE